MTVNCFVCNKNSKGELTDIKNTKEITDRELEEKEIELTYQFAEAMGYKATLIKD